jgi:hypothetical protein
VNLSYKGTVPRDDFLTLQPIPRTAIEELDFFVLIENLPHFGLLGKSAKNNFRIGLNGRKKHLTPQFF